MLYSVFCLLPLFRTQLCQTCTCLLLFLRTSWQRTSFPRWTAQTGKHKRFDKTSTKSFFLKIIIIIWRFVWTFVLLLLCQMACQCYGRLPCLGGVLDRGVGAGRAEGWTNQIHCLLASANGLLAQLYQGSETGVLFSLWAVVTFGFCVCLSPCQLTNNDNKKFFKSVSFHPTNMKHCVNYNESLFKTVKIKAFS